MDENTGEMWKEFRDTGLLMFVNMFLHIFGYAIAVDIDRLSGNVVNAYPKKVKCRGFSEHSEDINYKKVTEFMDRNASRLLNEINSEGK